MSLAVIGTGTEVGKTVVSAVLLARYAHDRPLAYWKPVASGARESRDTTTVAGLCGPGIEILPETYLFPEPLSPHLAARLDGAAIDPEKILADWRRHSTSSRSLVVEGIGGLLVPLTDDGYLLTDLLAALHLPCLLVAASGLGTINHTLLTLEALRHRHLPLLGVVLNGPPNPENRKAIETLGDVEVLAHLEPLPDLSPPSIAQAATTFDPEGRLSVYLEAGGPGGGEVGGRSDWRRRRVTKERSTPTSPPPGGGSTWVDDDRRHLWHPYTQMQTAPPALPVARAEGVWLHLEDGRRILDAVSSWWLNIHGHSHPRLNRALATQADRLAQVIFAGFTHEPASRLAAALVQRVPGNLPRVFFSDDGSTAVEVALKMAWQSWRNRGAAHRTLFVAFDDAYHGDTFGAMAASAVGAFHSAFGDLLFTVRRAATPHSASRGTASPSLAEILEREGERVAAVIVEPMLQGAGGMIVHPPAFLHEIRELTRRHGVPLIADEILTGFGRTGRLFACEHAGVVPDILCLSKALTGGYLPLAATLASEEIYAAFLSADRSRALFHGHSYTGNALACAVALESLALFEEEDRLGRIAGLERIYEERLARLADHPRIAATRALGGLAALDLRTDGPGGYLDEVGPRLAREFLDRGVLLRPLGNVLYLLPPYVISDDEVHHVFDVIEEVLGSPTR